MSAAPSRRNLLLLVPFALFTALAALLFFRLGAGDPTRLPSVLIGKPAPALLLPPLAGIQLPGVEPEKFNGQVTLVNVWASWCVPCRDEHPFLVKFAADKRISIVGINYKDGEENAREFLARLGNPYRAIGVDRAGRAAIEWGVYGVPETFLVGRDGKILYKQIGPIDDHSFALLMKEIEKAAN